VLRAGVHSVPKGGFSDDMEGDDARVVIEAFDDGGRD